WDDAHHGDKPTLLELAHGKRNRFLGVLEVPARLLTMIPNAHFRNVGRAVRETDASYQPWVPRVLPAQRLNIGALVVSGMPHQPTAVAGRRAAAAIAREAESTAEFFVVNGYANAYSSYVTTPEEYALQRYEGASTLYGEWSLPAWCTAFAALTRSLCAARD